jgi:hypothetical protein
MLTHRSREQGSGTPGRGSAARVRACSGEGQQGIGAAGSGTRGIGAAGSGTRVAERSGERKEGSYGREGV